MGGGSGGSADNGDADHNNTSISMAAAKNKKSGSFSSIFMHADRLDVFLMIFGLIGAIGDGIGTPLVLFITSKIMNNIGNFSGGIDSTFIHGINKVFHLFYFLFFSLFSFFSSSTHMTKY